MLKSSNIQFKIIQLLVCIFFSGLTMSAYAVDSTIDLSLPTAIHSKSFMLATNDSEVVNANTKAPVATPSSEFEQPLFSKRKIHQYFGLSTIAFAGLTALAAPEDCKGVNCPPRDVNGTHATLAKTTIALAAATIATGIYAHWDDFHVSDGWADPDNLHVLLGITGASLMAYAVNKSANSSVPVSHAGIAEAGAILMLVAIKLTW